MKNAQLDFKNGQLEAIKEFWKKYSPTENPSDQMLTEADKIFNMANKN